MLRSDNNVEFSLISRPMGQANLGFSKGILDRYKQPSGISEFLSRILDKRTRAFKYGSLNLVYFAFHPGTPKEIQVYNIREYMRYFKLKLSLKPTFLVTKHTHFKRSKTTQDVPRTTDIRSDLTGTRESICQEKSSHEDTITREILNRVRRPYLSHCFKNIYSKNKTLFVLQKPATRIQEQGRVFPQKKDNTKAGIKAGAIPPATTTGRRHITPPGRRIIETRDGKDINPPDAGMPVPVVQGYLNRETEQRTSNRPYRHRIPKARKPIDAPMIKPILPVLKKPVALTQIREQERLSLKTKDAKDSAKIKAAAIPSATTTDRRHIATPGPGRRVIEPEDGKEINPPDAKMPVPLHLDMEMEQKTSNRPYRHRTSKASEPIDAPIIKPILPVLKRPVALTQIREQERLSLKAKDAKDSAKIKAAAIPPATTTDRRHITTSGPGRLIIEPEDGRDIRFPPDAVIPIPGHLNREQEQSASNRHHRHKASKGKYPDLDGPDLERVHSHVARAASVAKHHLRATKKRQERPVKDIVPGNLNLKLDAATITDTGKMRFIKPFYINADTHPHTYTSRPYSVNAKDGNRPANTDTSRISLAKWGGSRPGFSTKMPVDMELAKVDNKISWQRNKKEEIITKGVDLTPSRLKTQSPPEEDIDVDRIAGQVYQLLERKIQIERERRGMKIW